MRISGIQTKHVFILQSWFIGIMTAVILLSSGNLMAQNNLSITFRSAANFPLKGLGEISLNKGGGFETNIAYRFMPHFGAYAGWGWNFFSPKESVNNSELQFEENGYTFGLQFIHPLSPESKLNYVLSGGGIYNHIETENENGEIIDDTGHALGWQAEAGLSIPIGHHDRWFIIPSFRYHELSGEMNSEGVSSAVDLNYISIGVGVTWKVWQAK